MKVFENDPFEPTYQAFKELYPDKDAICYWVYEIKDHDGNNVHGLTNFEDTDGENEIPIVYVDCNQSINEAGDVLCHELAHVAVGFGHGHDEAWENAYNAIYRRYEHIMGIEAQDAQICVRRCRKDNGLEPQEVQE